MLSISSSPAVKQRWPASSKDAEVTEVSFLTYCVKTFAGLKAEMRLGVKAIFLTSGVVEEGPAAAEEDDGSGVALEDAIDVAMVASCGA